MEEVQYCGAKLPFTNHGARGNRRTGRKVRTETDVIVPIESALTTHAVTIARLAASTLLMLRAGHPTQSPFVLSAGTRISRLQPA